MHSKFIFNGDISTGQLLALELSAFSLGITFIKGRWSLLMVMSASPYKRLTSWQTYMRHRLLSQCCPVQVIAIKRPLMHSTFFFHGLWSFHCHTDKWGPCWWVYFTWYFSLLSQMHYQFSVYGPFKQTSPCGTHIYLLSILWVCLLYRCSWSLHYTMYKLIRLWLNPFNESQCSLLFCY